MRLQSNMLHLLSVTILLALRSCAAGSRPTTLSANARAAPTLSADARAAVAGGLAGGLTNGILHPIDTAKTLRQRNPLTYKSTWNAVVSTVKLRGPQGLYGGLLPGAVGAIPSSALYFGTYESVKRRLKRGANRLEERLVERRGDTHRGWATRVRPAIHMLAAASGNAASSLVFVPKEVVKQKLQAARAAGDASATVTRVVASLLRQEGAGGLYKGYCATLLRNIPSAVIRFVAFEELKARLGATTHTAEGTWRLMCAGGFSGLLASTLTTPFDVLKTGFAAGRLDRSLGIAKCLRQVSPWVDSRGCIACSPC